MFLSLQDNKPIAMLNSNLWKLTAFCRLLRSMGYLSHLLERYKAKIQVIINNVELVAFNPRCLIHHNSYDRSKYTNLTYYPGFSYYLLIKKRLSYFDSRRTSQLSVLKVDRNPLRKLLNSLKLRYTFGSTFFLLKFCIYLSTYC